MSGVDPKKLAMASGAMREAREIHARRSAAGELKWCGLVYPSNGLAQEAGMSLAEYEDFVYGACFVDRNDPIGEWKKVSARQQRMVDYLDGVKRLEFYGEDTDIKMSLKGRRWMNSDGKHNMPSGEVFSAPVEDSVEGRVRFTYPGIFQGKEIEDVSLTFKKGKVVKAEAAKGRELLDALLAIDAGAKRLGEVAIGTNDGIKRFTKKILFDEKIGGTIHMALGSAYLECGAKNRSAIHWDLIKDMKKGGEIYGDGELIYKDGKFLK
jgi:aminopeptidase